MKKQLLAIVCLAHFGATQAQLDWKKWHGEPNQQETLIAAEPGADSTHFWAAGTIANGSQDDFWLMILDPQGKKLWSDTLGDPIRNERLSDFSRNPKTGEMWLIGETRPPSDWKNRQVFLQKLGAGGQLIFEKTGLFGHLGNEEVHLNIKTVGDGVFVFHQKPGILRRLDALGEVVWERTFSKSSDYFNKQNVAALPDGGCFFTENTSDLNCLLHRLDADGQTIWQKTLDFPPNLATGCHGTSVVADAADTSVFVAAQGGQYYGIQKFAADGQLIWKTDLPFEAYQNDFLDAWLLQMPEKNLIALFSNHAYQVLDDQTGAFVAGENDFDPYLKPEYVFLNDGVAFADGSFAVVGTTGKNMYGYDGYSAKMSADDFQILQKNTFGNPSPNDTDYEARVETAADGGYFLANIGYFENSKTGIALRKISADGAEIWKKGFVGSVGYWNLEMRRADDGNLFLMGHGNDSIDVMKLSPAGGLLWQRNFKMIGNIATVSISAPLKNGGIVVFHPNRVFQPNKRFWEARAFDENGIEIWVKRLFEGQIDDPNLQWGVERAEDLGDGTVGAVGSKFGNDGLAVRLDLGTGSPIFEKIIPDASTFWDLFPTGDGGFISLRNKYVGNGAGVFELFKIGAQGEVLAVQNLPLLPKDYSYFSKMHRAPDGSCVLSVLSDSLLEVFKLNDNLDLLDQKTVNLLPNLDWITGQKMLPDGSFLLCGEGANQNNYDVFLIKTGKSGIVSSQNLKNEIGFQVFPNPIFKDQPLQILLENNFLGKVKIELFTLDGRLFSIFEKEKTARRQVFEIGKLPAENSFLVRISDEKSSMARLVLRF